MTAVHPWNMVALAYAGGLLYAFVHLAERRPTPRSLCVFHLSVLGAGIFSYFQGRSHNGSLAIVSYPAIILAVFFLDRLLGDRAGKVRMGRLAAVGLSLFALALSVVGMARIAPAFLRAGRDQAIAILKPRETSVTRAARFVKDHTRPGEEVLMVSYLSGIFHLESRTLSPRGIVALPDRLVPIAAYADYLVGDVTMPPAIFLGSEWHLLTVQAKLLGRFNYVAAIVDGDDYMFLLAP